MDILEETRQFLEAASRDKAREALDGLMLGDGALHMTAGGAYFSIELTSVPPDPYIPPLHQDMRVKSVPPRFRLTTTSLLHWFITGTDYQDEGKIILFRTEKFDKPSIKKLEVELRKMGIKTSRETNPDWPGLRLGVINTDYLRKVINDEIDRGSYPLRHV